MSEAVWAFDGRAEAGMCDARVGPVPKLEGQIFWCCLPMGHDDGHEDVDGTWFDDSVARHSSQ